MSRIAAVISSHPRRILALTAVITLLAIASITTIRFNADVTSFITEGNERGEAFAALQEKYDTSDPINVVLSLPQGGSFADRDHLVELVELRDRLSSIDGVAAVSTIVPETEPITGQPLDADLIRRAPAPALGQISDSPLSGFLLSDDARHTLLIVVPEGDGIDVARVIGDLEAPEGAELTVAGNPAIFAAVIDILELFVLAIPPLVLVLLVLTFHGSIGDLRLSALSVMPALLGSIWTFGFITAIGAEVDIVTVIVPIFVLVMGSADGLHFVAHHQDAMGRFEDEADRIASTLREVGVPMILTTISTAVGFLSLLATDIAPIRQLGVFAAIGIVFAGIISFFSLPAVLSELSIEPAGRAPLLGRPMLAGLQWLVRRRWAAPTLVAVVVAFGAVFIPRLEVDSDPLFMFPLDHEIRASFERTEELFGGATPLVGEFAFDPAMPEESLREVKAASDDLAALPGVRSVLSAADVLGALGPDAARAALSGESPLPIEGLISEDGLRFLLFPGDYTASDLGGWVDFAEERPEVRIVTGLPVLWDEMARLIVGAQVWSVVAALALVAILLWITYRRIRPTLVALVPLVLTIVALLGFISASGIQLNLITAVASSIVIGVGIDYAIHFVAAIDHARPEGSGYVLRAIDAAGRPIVANALGIAVGLTALWLSPLRPHHHISGIMWVSMTVAALGALVVIPALLPRSGTETQVNRGALTGPHGDRSPRRDVRRRPRPGHGDR